MAGEAQARTTKAIWGQKLPCPKCDSSDGYQEVTDEYGTHFHCFVCGHHPSSSSTDRSGQEKVKDKVSSLPIAALKARGIPREVCQEYGVRVQYSEQTGEESAYFFPRTKKGKITGYQIRNLPKEFKSYGDTKDCELFGQSLQGESGKFLIITEGNEDCLAVRTMLLKQGKNYRVVSLPGGANPKGFKDNLEWIERFESVVLAFDQDKVGQDFAKSASEMLTPGRARIAYFSEKDANEMLLKGKDEEFIRAINNAKAVKPDNIVGIEEIYEEAIRPVERGLPWPWPTLTEITFGRRRREMYGFGAGTGAGKTEAFKEVMQHILTVEGATIGVFSLEEHPALTAKIIAGKMANKKFHVPDAGWTREELEQGIRRLEGRVYLYNHFGQKDWATIKNKIRYMVVSLGIKDIFLDHLTALVAETENVNKEFERVMADMAALSQELDFTLYFISHLTRPNTGPSHEEGGRVTVSQFRGSGAIGFWSNFLFALERDQQAEAEQDRNTVRLRVLKDRYTGLSTGRVINLNYNQGTGRFLEDTIMEF